MVLFFSTPFSATFPFKHDNTRDFLVTEEEQEEESGILRYGNFCCDATNLSSRICDSPTRPLNAIPQRDGAGADAAANDINYDVANDADTYVANDADADADHATLSSFLQAKRVFLTPN